MSDVALSLALTPIRWAGYAALLVCFGAAVSVLALGIGPVYLGFMLLDPNTPLWVPLGSFAAIVACIPPAVIVADCIDDTVGSSLADRVFARTTSNKIADWTVIVALVVIVVVYARST